MGNSSTLIRPANCNTIKPYMRGCYRRQQPILKRLKEALITMPDGSLYTSLEQWCQKCWVFSNPQTINVKKRCKERNAFHSSVSSFIDSRRTTMNFCPHISVMIIVVADALFGTILCLYCKMQSRPHQSKVLLLCGVSVLRCPYACKSRELLSFVTEWYAAKWNKNVDW